MKVFRVVFLTLCFLFFLVTGIHAFQKGMAFPLYQSPIHSERLTALEEVRGVGANHISIVFHLFVENIQASQITSDFHKTPTDWELAEVIRKARENKMSIMLFPLVLLKNSKKDEWRGILKPKNRKKWRMDYERIMLHYARLAQKEKVKVFCIGSELLFLEEDRNFWVGLIQKIRKIYAGKLIYSANWDHYEEVSFWDALDGVGINGYWELSAMNNPNLASLTLRLQKEQEKLLRWYYKKNVQKPLILTEVGYRSRDGANRQPWNMDWSGKIDLEEQYLCYQAFFRVWGNTPELKGIYFWNWVGKGGTADGSYTPRGKPAVQIITKWFLKKGN